MTIRTVETPGANAPSAAQQIRENLLEKHQTLRPRGEELIAELKAVPDPVPEDRIDEISELFVSVRTHVRLVDSVRVAEKEPYLRAERTIDAFFKGIADPLIAEQARAAGRHNKAVTIKADRVRQEEEDRTRREAERAAEAKRIADAKLAQEQADTEAARLAAEQAEQVSRDAAAALKEQNKSTKETEPNPARSPNEDVATASPRSLDDARTDGPAAQNHPLGTPPVPSPTLQERLAQEERDRVAERERRRAQEHLDRKAADLADATRSAMRAEHHAASAEVQHQRVIDAPAARFARSRSNYGALTTQQEEWDFQILDRAKLDKRVIWKFIAAEALQAAVQAAVDSGMREIKGVRIFKRRSTQVR